MITVFTTTARTTQDTAALGLSFPVMRAGTELLVTPYPPNAKHPAEFYQQVPNGFVIPANLLDFSVPEQK